MKKVYSKKVGGEVFALAPEQLEVFRNAGYQTPTPEEVIADAGAAMLTPPENKRAYVVLNLKSGEFAVRVRSCTLKGSEYIGELADGSVATYQTLPWNWRGWHAASGPNGSANNTHISFEICEDGLDDPVYFAKVYKEAAELTAYLCKLYDLDPEADGVVICHSEGHTRGIASNHGDVMHWFPRHGKNMDDFRAEVARLIKNQSGKDELDMTKEELVSCAGTGDNPSGWAREHTEYCKQKGIFAGDGAGNYGWQQPITREAVATIVHRALEVAGLADSIPDA